MKVKVVGIGNKGKEVIKNLKGKDFQGINLTAVEKESPESLLENIDLVLIVAGMENDLELKDTSSIARKSKELGVLSIAIVPNEKKNIEQLGELVDALIIASNKEAILDLVEKTIVGIEKTFIQMGLIDLDLSDAKALIQNSGNLFVGIGKSEGKDRALAAVEKALRNELIENAHIENANKVVVKVIGGEDLTIDEAYKAVRSIKERVPKSKYFFFGIGVDKKIEGALQVVVLAAIPN